MWSGRRFFLGCWINFEPLHGTTSGVKHFESQFVDFVVFAPARDMTHGMRDKATDGVEVGVIVLLCSVDFKVRAKRFCHAFERCVAADAIGVVCEGENITDVFLAIKLVLDVAYDLFEHILDGDESCNSTKFIDDQGHVIARVAEFTQQIIQSLALWHEYRRTQQRTYVQ